MTDLQIRIKECRASDAGRCSGCHKGASDSPPKGTVHVIILRGIEVRLCPTCLNEVAKHSTNPNFRAELVDGIESMGSKYPLRAMKMFAEGLLKRFDELLTNA